MNKSTAEQRLASLSMDDMPVLEIPAVPHAMEPDWFSKYKTLRRDFMKSLDDSLQELSFFNLSREEFFALLSGRELPENCSLRLRVPLYFGGKLEIKNMFMCKTFPHGQNMDRFLIEQSGNPTLFVPNPAKKIYIPAHMLGGGDGGNATSDRLAQMAASMGGMGIG